MSSIARTFGAPVTVPAGMPRANTIERVALRRQDAAHVRDEVHDVAVALDRSGRPDRDRAGDRDASQIVPSEIDEHHVLGRLFGVGEQLRARAPSSSSSSCAARARPRDRTQRASRPLQLDERLRELADDREASDAERRTCRARVRASRSAR